MIWQTAYSWSHHMVRIKRIWYLSPMRAAKVQASLRIRAVSPEPSLLAHTSSESRGTFRQKTRSLAPLNGWTCAVEICHDGMLEDTNSLDGAHIIVFFANQWIYLDICKVISMNGTKNYETRGPLDLYWSPEWWGYVKISGYWGKEV